MPAVQNNLKMIPNNLGTFLGEDVLGPGTVAGGGGEVPGEVGASL
jgi:hypothetical protein